MTPFIFSNVFSISKKSKKIFFLTPLEKSKNFNFFLIFNNIGSHDVLRKKITKIGQNAANPGFFNSPCIHIYTYTSIFKYISLCRKREREKDGGRGGPGWWRRAKSNRPFALQLSVWSVWSVSRGSRKLRGAHLESRRLSKLICLWLKETDILTYLHTDFP